MENNEHVSFLGWEKISFVEREDSTEEIKLFGNELSFFKGAFTICVPKVEDIRKSSWYVGATQEFLINQTYIFKVTLGYYGKTEYLCTYLERQEEEKKFGKIIYELARWANVPWHIAKITKGMDMIDAYEILYCIRKVAKSASLSPSEKRFLKEKDLPLRNCILEGLFPKRIWQRMKEAVTENELNSRYLAFYILTKGEIKTDLNIYCDLPKAYTPASNEKIFEHKMNVRMLKGEVERNFALCTANIEDNYEAVMLLKHIKNVVATTAVEESNAYLFCSSEFYYRNAIIRHYLGEEIWKAIGNVVLNNFKCSSALGKYIYMNRLRSTT